MFDASGKIHSKTWMFLFAGVHVVALLLISSSTAFAADYGSINEALASGDYSVLAPYDPNKDPGALDELAKKLEDEIAGSCFGEACVTPNLKLGNPEIPNQDALAFNPKPMGTTRGRASDPEWLVFLQVRFRRSARTSRDEALNRTFIQQQRTTG